MRALLVGGAAGIAPLLDSLAELPLQLGTAPDLETALIEVASLAEGPDLVALLVLVPGAAPDAVSRLRRVDPRLQLVVHGDAIDVPAEHRGSVLRVAADAAPRDVALCAAALAAKWRTENRLDAPPSARMQSQWDILYGALVAAAAGHLSTPLQYASDSIHYAREGLAELLRIAGLRSWVIGDFEAGRDATARLEELAALEQSFATRFDKTEIERALDRALGGVDQIAALLRSVKEFAVPMAGGFRPADLNRLLDALLPLADLDIRPSGSVTRVVSDLPPVECQVRELAEAVLILLRLSAAALRDAGHDAEHGRVVVETRVAGDHAEILITDNGARTGNEPAAATAREADAGMSRAEHILVDIHGGSLEIDTAPGGGQVRRIRLPWRRRPGAPATAAA